jgi:hypothetical protein
MSQAWVQVLGLVVEFLGVLVLAWEWFAARRQDLAVEALAEAEARREAGRAGLERLQADNPAMQRHFEMVRDMDRRRTAHEVDRARSHYGGLRARAVVMALLLVALGFGLQLLGTVPGCCPALGVGP